MASVGGFTVSSSPSAIGVRAYRVPGTSVLLPVRSEIAPLLIGFAREFHLTVEPLVPGWNWGYHYRSVTGGGGYSFHAAGIAIDLNAPRHPYGRANTFSSADATRIRALCRKYGLRWGGDYRYTKDEMHVEVIVGRTAALDLVRRLQTVASVVPSIPTTPTPEDDVTETELISATRKAVVGLLDEAAIRSTATGRALGDDINRILTQSVRVILFQLLDEVANRSTATGRAMGDDFAALHAALNPDA